MPTSPGKQSRPRGGAACSSRPLNAADQGMKPEKVAEFGKKVPLERPAQPEEIAPAYVFLASPQTSSYITGEILPIIGGYSGG